VTAAAQATDPPADTSDNLISTVLENAHAAALKVARLKRDFDGAHRLAHQAEVREALTRSELTIALNETLAARAELAGRLREQALAGYLARAGAVRLRRHNRISQALDRVLVRLGSFGQALVIARSGVWRGTGRALHDLRHMAAYARRRADPRVVPLTLFDQAWRLAHSPDLAAGGLAPLVHYLIAGAREGRDPHPLFDEGWYGRENAHELAATSVSGLEHYIRAGAARGRNPHPLFDMAHYLAQGPTLASGEDLLTHYLREGGRLGLSPHPLFDPAWYAEQAPEAVGTPSLIHYLSVGWRAGLTPHPLFDPQWYLEHHPQVAELGAEPLTHFVSRGAFELLSPSPWFDLPQYMAVRSASLSPGVNPLVDYLQGGAWSGAASRPGFPTAAYLASRPELARSGLTPLEHWARRGGR